MYPVVKARQTLDPVATRCDGFLLLHAKLGKGCAVGSGRVFTGIIENLEIGVPSNRDDGWFCGQQTGGRGLEVVVGQRVFSAPQFLLEVPGIDDVVLVKATGHQVVSGILLPGAFLMGAGGVSNHHGVLPFFMLEEVEDAVLLHEARDEVEVCFAVLNTVLHRRVAAVERELVVLKASIAENLLDDVVDFLVMENLAVGVPRQHPYPRNYFHLVMGEAGIRATLAKVADHAIEVASLLSA